MRVPMNDPRRTAASTAEEISNAVSAVVQSGRYLRGAATTRFESSFAAAVGAEHCVGVANGTDALELAMRALGVEKGDRIVTVANAGGYSLTAAMAVGAVPVFVDVDPSTLTIDVTKAVDATDGRTKLVVATHLFGLAVDIAELRRRLDAAGHLDVAILEDAAQAHGATVDGERVGSLGDAASFSFYPTKNLGALGDAGAVTTSRHDVAERVRQFAQYGWSERYVSTRRGGMNSRIDEIQAAVLTLMLPHLDGWNERRRAIVAAYASAAPAGISIVHDAFTASERFVGHLAVARSSHRDALAARLDAHGVDTALHYPVLDVDVPWLGDVDWSSDELPQSHSACDEILSLPCFPALSDTEVDHVCSGLADFVATGAVA